MRLGLGLIVGAALAVGGCVERKESILVTPGRVDIRVEHHTKQQVDLRNHDAAPSIRGGWLVEERSELEDQQNPDADRIFYLVADASFPIQGPLPSSFAEAGEADADVYLQFPTRVKIEQRRDGTYYHFSRRYEGRLWAEYEAHEKAMKESLKDFKDAKPEQLTHENRVTIVHAFVDLEIYKKLLFARRAFADLGEHAGAAPQDAWLAARASVLAIPNELDYDALARMIESDDEDPEKEKLIDAEAKALEARIERALDESLRDAGLPGAMLAQFTQRFHRHHRYHQVTEDLNDDNFKISIEMPGHVVGSNADQFSGGKAVWKFAGSDLHDRDAELFITSRVAR